MSNVANPQAILVLPRLQVQNANAISSALTHGFPSITAFVGLMWAFERKLAKAGVPLHLHGVGVICHHHQEQITQGYVRTFNLTRNPLEKDGSTAAIVEEGRIHLDITLVFGVSRKSNGTADPAWISDDRELLERWADQAGRVLSQMRVAGGSVLPAKIAPGRRTRPWMAVLADDALLREQQFRRWRRQWLPGFALVGRDDLLAQRLVDLRAEAADTTLLDAWLHAARFNFEPDKLPDGRQATETGKVAWRDRWRGPGSGWIVPIPVGYASLSDPHAPHEVSNTRDATTMLRFVESVYSLGEWVGPQHLDHLEQLLWRAETDAARGLFRCRSGYAANPETAIVFDEDDELDEGSYAYA